jgi:hypothetical protein
MLSKYPQIVNGMNNGQLTLFKVTAADSVTYVRKVKSVSGTGYAIELVKQSYTRDSGFVYFVNDTLVSSNAIYAKVGPSGMEEWARQNPGNFPKHRINDIELVGDKGYLYTGKIVQPMSSRTESRFLKQIMLDVLVTVATSHTTLGPIQQHTPSLPSHGR